MLEVYAVKAPDGIDDATFEVLLMQTSKEKRARIRRFRRKSDKLSCLFSDLLVRSIIMKKTGLKNEDIRFAQTQYGKPYLEGRNDIHFNISHSGIWIVAAVDSQPVGIDVEQVRDDFDMRLSHRIFSDDEHNDLMNQEDRKNYFFTLWSLKESYLKNTGKGLSQPMNSFSIRAVKTDKYAVFADGRVRENVTFAEYHIHKEYKMFLCAGHNRVPRHVTMAAVDGLIDQFNSAWNY